MGRSCCRSPCPSSGDVPVYLLDTDLPGNDPADRALTGALYGGDERYRLAQEAVLGIGGVRMLRALGHDRIERFHLNEGHAALAVLALAEEGRPLAEVRRACVFTTHTPVPAGHDRFPAALVREVLGSDAAKHLAELGQRDTLNQTELATYARLDHEPAKLEEVSKAARKLMSRPDQTIIVTLGKTGVAAVRRDEAFLVEGRKVKAVDTVGAGDCFCGALAAGLAANLDLREAVEQANAAAALSVQKPGAAPSMPSKREVEVFLEG